VAVLEAASLNNQLLIAMPGMADPNFSSTVTLICEHSDEGALGIVINRPLLLTLGDVFKQLHMEDTDSTIAERAVMDGGPVGADRGFVLHDPRQTYEHSIEISDEIHLTFSRDVLNAIATGDGPEKSLVALGYAGWGAGQLENEMLANSWLSVAATPDIVFELPFDQRWAAAARTLGIDITQIAPDAGHA
jgi:putative transcriptional regulator